jgi:hypothetical protein
MRMAAVGYYPSFPVKYSNMYNDYSMVTAGLADPFLPQKKEKSDKCNFVVSYIGKNEPKFEMNNPHYMREVSRSHSDSIPPAQDDSKYTKPGLRKRIFNQVKAGSKGGKPGQWSARKAQLVAQKYKAQGGGYKGGKGKKQKDLKRWGKEKWMTRKEYEKKKD